MSGNKKLTIVLISLIPLVLYYIISDKGGSLKTGPDLFAVSDPEKISTIIIEKDKERILLEKDEQEWTVKEQYGADPGAVSRLKNVLSGIRIKAPVAKSDQEQIRRHLEEDAVEVQIFSDRKKVQHYLVYSEKGRTYMVQKGKKKPLEVYLPGIEKEAGSFFVTDEIFWRDNRLTRLKPSEIDKVTLRHAEDSFSIIRKGRDHFQIGEKQAGSFQIESYLQSLQVVRVSYSDSIPMDIFTKDHFYAEIILRTNTKRRIAFTFYKIPVDPFTDEFGRKVSYDLNRLSLNMDGMKATVRYIDIDPLLKKREYFFQ
jgi:hypothetical protein